VTKVDGKTLTPTNISSLLFTAPLFPHRYNDNDGDLVVMSFAEYPVYQVAFQIIIRPKRGKGKKLNLMMDGRIRRAL
jgi:hypothetical protein